MALFSCSRCANVYESRGAFRSHLRVHDGTAPQCVPCNRAFASRADLQRHLDSGVHAGKRPHVCAACGVGFTKRSHLTRHTKQQHLGVVTFEDKCSRCSSRLDTQFRPLKVCRFHATELGIVSPNATPPGVSKAACACFDVLERMLGLQIQHVHFATGADGTARVTGSEVEGLIPGRRSRPDGVCTRNRRHVYEYLGNPWHGFPPSDVHEHRYGRSHTGKTYKELYVQTMARLWYFHDHGFVVHYIWEHEYRAANKEDPRELLAVVHVLNPFERLLGRM